MIRAILFDCFGVIITDALKVVIDELNVSDPALSRQVMDIIHANNRGLITTGESNQQIAGLFGIDVDEWRGRIEHGEVKDEHVLTYLKELRKRGYKTALLSNVGRDSLNRRFSEDELQTHFDVVVASGEVGVMKPEPEIYLHTAQQLGVEPDECVMVDDREAHCAGARAVGMQSICYVNFYDAQAALEQVLKQPS
jgi:putative hydrolase of the HAD superfamily/hydrolase